MPRELEYGLTLVFCEAVVSVIFTGFPIKAPGVHSDRQTRQTKPRNPPKLTKIQG